ncbi:MAG: glycosyltransferase [Kofleriaceae bacterium]|nr:glycosyltransferase [Kofleriaceae bacterium]
MGKLCQVEVLATVPWYPGQRLLGRFATHKVAGDVPKQEVIDGLTVYHPRTLHLPKIGSSIATPLFAASLAPLVARYRSKIDIVLAAWAHPDGCAAVLLAKMLGVPVVVKVHGTDINSVAQQPGPKRVMRALLPKADGLVAVSSALGKKLENLGVESKRIHLIMNGVDDKVFHVRDRKQAREELGLPLDAKIALYIGNIIEAKGIVDLHRAFQSITDANPDMHLYCVGDGNQRAELSANAPSRMTFVGSQPFEKIPQWLAACDLLVLPSWNEGTPNVVLEALACGRRVLASDVGGIPDLLRDPKLGAMVAPKAHAELANLLPIQLRQPYDANEVAALGSRGNWQQSASELHALLHSCLA